MKEIQLLHKGKVFHGHVGYEADFLEVELSPTNLAAFACGDKVLCFDFQRRLPAVILHKTESKIVLALANSEIFQIEARPRNIYEEFYSEDKNSIKSYKLNTFATITDDFTTRAVRLTDVSRLGIGFEIDDFNIKMNEVYETTVFSDNESIRMQLVVQYAHIMEKTIRYGCEIHNISSKHLQAFRYFILMQQFKQLMLV